MINSRVIRIDPRKLKLLDLNARFMRHETFQQLVKNIKHDGVLTQLPFAVLCREYDEHGDPVGPPIFDEAGDGVYEVLGGNHRTKAAIAAGLEEIDLIVSDDPMTKQQRVGIQLSHNSIEGEDDPATLKQLYEMLDVDWRQYTGLDDKTLELLKEVKPGSLSEANLSFQMLSLVFLPDELDRVRATYETVKKLLKKTDERWLLRWAEYDRLLDTLDDTSSAHGVKNAATALMIMLDIVDRHMDDLAEGFVTSDYQAKHNGLVPLQSILGTTKVAAKQAAVIKRAIDKMQSKGEVKKGNVVEGLAIWAAAYLEQGKAEK